MRMKKWKWDSIIPPDRCTSTDEQNTRPAVEKKAASRRFRTVRASTRLAVGVTISSATSATSKPWTRPNTNSAGMWSPRTQQMKRWRRWKVSGSSMLPVGNHSRTFPTTPGPPESPVIRPYVITRSVIFL